MISEISWIWNKHIYKYKHGNTIMHFPFVPLLDVTHFGGHSHKGWNCKCGFGLNFYNFSIRTYALWKHAIIIYYYADLERFLNQKILRLYFEVSAIDLMPKNWPRNFTVKNPAMTYYLYKYTNSWIKTRYGKCTTLQCINLYHNSGVFDVIHVHFHNFA